MWKPFGVGLFVGMYQSLSTLVFLSGAWERIPENTETVFLIGSAIGVGGIILGIIVTWLLVAVGVHGIAVYGGATLELRETVRYTGFAFLPKSLVGLASAIGMYLMLQRLRLPTTVPELNQLSQQIQVSVPFLIINFIGTLVLFWSAIIVAEAIDVHTALTDRWVNYAAICPFALLAVYRLINLITLS